VNDVHFAAIARARFASAEAALRALAASLAEGGAVRDGFGDALVAREIASPTGLPLAGGAVALPHADPTEVLRPAVAVATLVEPVAFRQMGSPEVSLPVAVVIALALCDRGDAQAGLVRMLRALQRPGAVAELRDSADDASLATALERLWTS
jgi:PTS system galactitol-specific IIA component